MKLTALFIVVFLIALVPALTVIMAPNQEENPTVNVDPFNASFFNASNTIASASRAWKDGKAGMTVDLIGDAYITLDSTAGGIYQPRTLYLNSCAYPSAPTPCLSSPQNVTAYLLLKTQGTPVTFIVRSTAGTTLPGVVVSVMRVLSTGTSVIENGMTDASGAVVTYLNPTASYTIYAAKNGYTTTSSTITPSSSTYSIVLAGGSAANLTSFFFNTSYSITPLVPSLDNMTGGQLSTITFVTAASDNGLKASNLTVTYWNGSTICNLNTNATAGGTLACALNISNLTGNVTSNFLMTRFNTTEVFNMTINYQILSPTRYSYVSSAAIINQYFTPWSKLLLAIIISLGITILVSAYLGFGSSIVTILALSAFFLVGWVPFPVYAIAAFLVAALFVTGRFNL